MLFKLLGLVIVIVVVLVLLIWKKAHPTQKKDMLPATKVSPALTVINGVQELGRNLGLELVTIKPEEIISLAKEVVEMPGVEDVFGPQDEFLKGVTLYVKGLDTKRKMSASGAILLKQLLIRLINTRKNVMEYVIKNKEEVLKSALDKPVIITGLGRTGSTMLYNLMACDPKSRAPRFFEISHMANPAPPTTEETFKTDARIKDVEARFDWIEKNYPFFFTEAGKSHRSHPTELEEELLVLLQCFTLQLWVPLSDSNYREWYENPNNKEFAYIYLRLFLQMLNSTWTPKSHWVLKAPIHATYINELHRAFPDARLIFTHRNPYKVVPSWARLLQSYLGWYFKPNAISMKEYGKYISDSHYICVDRMIEFQKQLDDDKYLNLDYDEFVKNPIDTVRSIYEFFNIEYTDEFEQNMKQWIKDNRQGKYGRAAYSLKDYNLTEEYISKRFSSYIENFLNPDNFK